jgi:thiol reductant ABC exporter CydC subunit
MTALAGFLGAGRAIRSRFALALVVGVATAGVAVALTATSAWLISRASEQPPILYLMVAIVAVRAFGILRGVLRYAERLTAHDAAFRVLAALRVQAFSRLEGLAPAGLGSYRTGDLLARLVADIDSLADVWLRVLLPYGSAIIVGLATSVLVGWLVPGAGAILAATLAIVAVLAPIVATWVGQRADSRIAPLRGRFAGEALETIEAAAEIVTSGARDRRLAALAVSDALVRDAEARSATGTGVGAFLTGLASGIAVWSALALGVGAVAAGRLDGVMLAVVVLTPIAVHETVADLSSGAQQVPRLMAAAARVADVLDRPDPVRDPPQPRAVPDGPLGLRIRGLSAGYRPGVLALSGVDLDLEAGGLAIVTGPSGSGKSTLAAVLTAFLAPAAGRVEFIGSSGPVALEHLSGDDVRQAVGLCAQDVHVFDTNIAENVRLARPGASDDVVLDVLGRVGLGDWIGSLPNGLATMVGEHGAHLSGGQAQRLGLARAILADRRIMVFDEPTEHVDDDAGDRLIHDLLTACAGRTIIVITHRSRVVSAVAPSVVLRLRARPARIPGRVDTRYARQYRS